MSVGWSKLCQTTSLSGERSTRLPESSRRRWEAGTRLSERQTTKLTESETVSWSKERESEAEERSFNGV